MFGRTLKLPLDIELGVLMVEQKQTSHQNYAQKLHSKLQWAYQKAQGNNKTESECHKRYYDQKMRCMKLKPDDLVMMQVKALTGDHKLLINGKIFHIKSLVNWVISLFFKYNPINAITDNNIKILHRNMLFPLETSEESDVKETGNEQNTALMRANLLMDVHFNN